MLINPYAFGGRLWTPADITTTLWLDAADASTITTVSGDVSQWNDKSGNNINLTQQTTALRPTFASNVRNGLSAIFFNTTGTISSPNRKYLTGNFAYTGNQISFFSVHIHNNAVNTATNYGRVFSLSDDSKIDFNNTNGIVLVYGASPGISLYRNNAVIASTSAINNSWCLVDAERNAGAGRISLNGGTYVTGTTSAANKGITRVRVGSENLDPPSNADGGISGYIAENIIITGDLSDATRQKLQGYLAHKWGLTSNLPSDHPYKTVGPTR